MEDLLRRNGIDPNVITSENQFKGILNLLRSLEKSQTQSSGITGTTSAKVFNRMGEELDPNQPIIGGTQPGKSIDQDTLLKLARESKRMTLPEKFKYPKMKIKYFDKKPKEVDKEILSVDDYIDIQNMSNNQLKKQIQRFGYIVGTKNKKLAERAQQTSLSQKIKTKVKDKKKK